MQRAGIVVELWRYPVKSMCGERIDAGEITELGLRTDRLWAVRDEEADGISNARRLPALLRCSARFAEEPPPTVGPGNAPEVIVTLPDDSEVSSSDPAIHARLSELVGKAVRLAPLPPVTEKRQHRAKLPTKASLRSDLGLSDDDPIPDLSVMPVGKLAQAALYTTPVGSYVDAYPLHIITRASLQAMSELQPASDFDVRRFRPNVVLETEGGPGLHDLMWIGGVLYAPAVALKIDAATIRCVMPTREQPGVSADRHVMRTIAAHADSCLGVYAEVRRPGRLAVGDELNFEAPAQPGPITGVVKAGATGIKRRLLRASNAALPRG